MSLEVGKGDQPFEVSGSEEAREKITIVLKLSKTEERSLFQRIAIKSTHGLLI